MGSCHSEQLETMQAQRDTSSPLPILTSWLLTGMSITSLNKVIFTLSFFWGLACIGCFCTSIIIAVATSALPNVVLRFYFDLHMLWLHYNQWCRIYSSFRAYCYSVSLLAPSNSVLQTNDFPSGEVAYEVHTTGNLLEKVNTAISQQLDETFQGVWLLVVYWNNVVNVRYPTEVSYTSGKIISSKWKGDIGMAWSTKKEETRGHYTPNMHKATWHHPYIFVSYENTAFSVTLMFMGMFIGNASEMRLQW